MKRRRALRVLSVAAAGSAAVWLGRQSASCAAPEAIILKTDDGWTVFADSYPGPQRQAPVVLLFHQAGSSKGEYRSIAPKLNALGYNALAIDQRVGGDLFDVNETVTKNPGKTEPQSRKGYLDALTDLQTALSWARTAYPASRIILWGSSYSSDLVFLVAAKSPKNVAAILSFSPDPVYLGDPSLVLSAARQIRVPVLIVAGPGEEAGAKSILQALPGPHKQLYVAPHGVHGSSTLLASKNAAGADANWTVVKTFLKGVRE